ncbi:outer membrane beta-barrel protein [Bradyrhizobium sp. NAS80.1]|uniref:outer membrane protein n=1 Tax=Bradyrhizobium sp. NAS80.1 TaxID=1680159 RepID=UPI000A034974|nr:outer membrane beta-barrel protein [Bradyrhizobium sp. NAS80.1]
MNSRGANWTGWYVGVNAGASLSQVNAFSPNLPGPDVVVGELDIAHLGATGGVQAGFNWQASPSWVAGLEADFGHLGIERTVQQWNDQGDALEVKADWYGTIRGRLGYTTGPSLLYVTGGAAFVNVKNTFSSFDDFSRSSVPVESSKTATGWTLGGGIETMLGGNWSAKAEYLYIDAGDAFVNGARFFEKVSFENRFHIYRAGLNYKLGG